MAENEFKLTFKNYELSVAIEFLQGMKLKATDSRHRTKLVKELMRYSEDLYKEQMALIAEYGKKDNEGNLVPSEDGENYLIESERIKEYKKDNDDLLSEEVIVTGGAYINNIKQLGRVLSEYNGELFGVSAEIYDRLLDEFEKNVLD